MLRSLVGSEMCIRDSIYTMRLPEVALPSGVCVEELEDSPTRKYRYRLIVNADRDVDTVLSTLKESNQMFATRIEETNPWYRKIVDPEGKSFFFRALWAGFALSSAFGTLVAGIIIYTNETLRAQLIDAYHLFVNG